MTTKVYIVVRRKGNQFVTVKGSLAEAETAAGGDDQSWSGKAARDQYVINIREIEVQVAQ